MFTFNASTLLRLGAPVLLSLAAINSTHATTFNDAGLLRTAETISQQDATINQQREKLFALAQQEQARLLNASEKRVSEAEALQVKLKAQFEANEQRLAELETQLKQKAGTLGEVFGVTKEHTLELIPMLQDSLTSADHPGRAQTLLFAESKRIPTINDFKTLQAQLVTEMKATGEKAQFSTPVIGADGSQQQQNVIRFGTFSALDETGNYLAWDIQQQALKVLPTQPQGNFSTTPQSLARQPTNVLLDPTRGELFALLDRVPSLLERIKQGGSIGWLIIAIGVLGLLVALYQICRLLLTEIAVERQLNRLATPLENNPLGRILIAAENARRENNQNALEMQMDESLLQELPRLERGQSFLKLLAAVAPLLGLLGTVVGMIATFQSITLFGTSDPKLMANGISQALMTTVLGLVVAVPVLFSHSLLAARGRRLMQLLQGKSLAAMALYAQPASVHNKQSDLHAA
ncbi:MotA/TolQ/ExbB proton channel family protein [Aestuariirhabdus sp. Z084]|uniref:MotA/TolQ/ExbB proton channel family protein n=1 Tax=Aestuariirhabdus haliotis TaxID=2918751 RepID=UPI0020C11CD2|nr:MotA/TolQ/ExbB proton channel family protein [Aestuariirhabdus haliotis]MCL6417570.1 MotA/TolQ/ExbB proton channel family protein [Aestuariirhabdus haliotis]